MKIEAHIIVWNESETIHLTVKHYQQFCSRVIIYDNYSTDNTRSICESMGCEVKLFGIEGVLSDVEYTKLKNNVWKGSDADWVIVCDADEILDFTDLIEVKNTFFTKQPTILRTYGWNVYSSNVPYGTWGEIKTGFHDPNYSKLCIFNPKEIKEINYVHGCHVANPIGNVCLSSGILTLFHYRNVGGPERLIKRHELYRKRMSPHNIKWGMGSHYLIEDEQRIKEWYEQYEKSVEFSPDFISQSQIETQR